MQWNILYLKISLAFSSLIIALIETPMKLKTLIKSKGTSGTTVKIFKADQDNDYSLLFTL